MNNKQLILIILIALTFYAMRSNGQSTAGQPVAQVADCGAAPGDADMLTKLSWALCESKKSVDANASNGGR